MDVGSQVTVLYNAPYQMPFQLPIAQYFYFTGLSAGSFVVSVIAVLGGKTEYKPLGKIGAILAPLCLVLAPMNLLADMTQPLRFWHLMTYLPGYVNFRSPITYGVMLLTSYPISAIVYAYFVYSGNLKWSKIMAIIGIPLAIAVHGYTGFILALGKGRALWNTALMPTLFIVSAMVSGIALMIIMAVIRNLWMMRDATSEERQKDAQLIYGLGNFLGAAIVTDLFLLFNAVLVILTSSQEAFHAAELLLWGHFAAEFIGVELIIGSLIPLVIVFYPKTKRSFGWLSLASVMTMVGIFAMRFTVVVGGQSVPLH
ncbi:MAG: polysulfide reductase NrfD [Nitrospirota bacterium]|jgi:tetrathionate reductase subunit C